MRKIGDRHWKICRWVKGNGKAYANRHRRTRDELAPALSGDNRHEAFREQCLFAWHSQRAY